MRQIEKQQLANGIILTYLDGSKVMAGDRWIVRITCAAEIPLAEWMVQELEGDGPEAHFVRGKIADRLTHEIFMERVFVEQDQKDEVLSELLARIKQNIVSYLAKEDFVTKLFLKKVAALKEEFILRPVETPEEDCSDDDCGPADFSACFK